MTPRHIKSNAELREVIASAGEKLVVVDFTASWCPPCRAIAPHFEKLAETTPDVIFLTVLESEAGEVVAAERIRGFPTFRFYKDGKQVHEIVGADLAGITSTISRLK